MIAKTAGRKWQASVLREIETGNENTFRTWAKWRAGAFGFTTFAPRFCIMTPEWVAVFVALWISLATYIQQFGVYVEVVFLAHRETRRKKSWQLGVIAWQGQLLSFHAIFFHFSLLWFLFSLISYVENHILARHLQWRREQTNLLGTKMKYCGIQLCLEVIGINLLWSPFSLLKAQTAQGALLNHTCCTVTWTF